MMMVHHCRRSIMGNFHFIYMHDTVWYQIVDKHVQTLDQRAISQSIHFIVAILGTKCIAESETEVLLAPPWTNRTWRARGLKAVFVTVTCGGSKCSLTAVVRLSVSKFIFSLLTSYSTLSFLLDRDVTLINMIRNKIYTQQDDLLT